jgi:hypothetical protein
MRSVAILALGLQSAGGAADPPRLTQCQSLAHAPVTPMRVRGRLYGANGGGSGFRIWLVGTRRIVWLTPRIEPAVPAAITATFKPFDEELYGDFTLLPLRPDRPGVMREVCFVSGERLVVREVQTGRTHPAKSP